MLEINYKKVAMIEPHIEVKKGTTIIPVSIDFIPTRVFVTIHEDGGLPNGYSIDSNFKISITSANRTVIEGSIKYNESEKNITIRFATNPGEYDEIMYVQSIVLIE